MNAVEQSWWPTGSSRLIFILVPVGAGLLVLTGATLLTERPPIVAVLTAVIAAGIALTSCAAGRGIRRGQSAGTIGADRANTLRQVRGRLPYGPQEVPRMRPVAQAYGRSCTDSILFSAGLVALTAGLLGLADTGFIRAIAGLGLVVVAAALVYTVRDLGQVRRFLAATGG